ncbi:1-phosphofructokinase [Enterococcus sp. DIV0876]|uniref:1-phosphofructokinase n=1 Tax=Enterococcus sp. DIV0876 TaxID=2774633 RepID=UPI003D300A1F
MIYTVTLNPSIDFIVHVDQLTIGALNKMTQDFKLPGGKGINVSRILKRINIDSTALGFVGGFTGKFISDWLTKEAIHNQFTAVADDTRINIKLKSGEETEINGLGPAIHADEIADLKAKFNQLQPHDIVILSGSKPAGLAADFYEELISLVQKAGADFVIDTTGAELFAALPARPLLIKPNNHELAELYETSFSTIEDILPYGQKMLQDGAKNVIVSLGGDGALLFSGDKIYQTNVLKRPLKNSVGAGDSMIAGFIGRYAKTQDVVDAFKWGVACGSATAFSDDLAQADFIHELLPEVEVKEIFI